MRTGGALIAGAALAIVTAAGACADSESSGSCTYVFEAGGPVTSCENYRGPSFAVSGQEETCDAATYGSWSGGPCDATASCGRCETWLVYEDGERRGTAVNHYFDGIADEAELVSLCASNPNGAVWIDNPRITCRRFR